MAKQPRFQIAPAAIGIDQLIRQTAVGHDLARHRIDGEIASHEVFESDFGAK